MVLARSLAALPLRRLATAGVARASLSTASRPLISNIPRQPLFIQKAQYSAPAGGLSEKDIESRIHSVLKAFEKVPAEKLAPGKDLSFTSDLGLDSLDVVEVVMAIEEEFSVEISDDEADSIDSLGKAITYIQNTPQAM